MKCIICGEPAGYRPLLETKEGQLCSAKCNNILLRRREYAREKQGFRIWAHSQKLGTLEKRGWIHLGKFCLGWSYHLWTNFCHCHWEIGGEDCFSCSVAFPPVAFWLHFEIPYKLARRIGLPDEEIKTGIDIHHQAIWWTFFIPTWASNQRYKWYRAFTFHYVDFLLGEMIYESNEGEKFDILIPMPEGVYKGKAKKVISTWRRPGLFWDSKVWKGYSIKVERGIPFEGKGENSYDCGEDGLFGVSAQGPVENAIGKYVTAVLEYRRKYGTPGRIRDAIPVFAGNDSQEGHNATVGSYPTPRDASET